MRVFAATLLAMSLAASPLLANNANETGKEDTPAVVSATSAVPDKPAAAAKPEISATESEMQDLRSLVEEQRAELEAQRAALKAEQLKMEALEEKLGTTPSEPAASPAPAVAISSVPSTSAIGVTLGVSSVSASPAMAGPQNMDEASPLQFHIGSAYITPIGFMDFTTVFRNHNQGSGIGTNFGNITIGNVAGNHLSEWRQSMQNSRIGFRVDAMVKGAHVIGYMESDYLGNNGGNVAVSSNSNTLRSRLYWVDLTKDKWEILGGQTWSLITPGRSGISPLPGNLFYSQDIDVNYQLGLVWGRIPEFRVVYHPTSKVAFAFALDEQEQYVGGSGGGPSPTFPALLALAGNQLNNGTNTLNTPNVAPDVIMKLAFDPSSRFHVEVGGVERQFKIWNPNTNVTFQNTGAGGFLNLNVEAFKGFRLLTNNYWSDGGGRYIFGVVPDLILRADGSISPIHTGSTVSGIEFTHKNTLLYAYYGGIYVARNVALDANGTTPIGYGYAQSTGGSQNRMLQEETIGFNQTIWKDAKYGALNVMGQYSYEDRRPWSFVGAGAREANLNQVYLNLRYTLPGSAPAMK